jgi:hypothetical protein
VKTDRVGNETTLERRQIQHGSDAFSGRKLSGQSVSQARLKVGMALQRSVTYSNAATFNIMALAKIFSLGYVG